MTSQEAKEQILNEYPYLIEENVQIVKQFTSSDGRVSNAFLVTTKKKGFEKFVAKSFVHNPESLEREYIVLKMLEENNFQAPRLLLYKHQPKHFLLLEYIEGVPASDLVKNADEIERIIKEIGISVGKLNSIKVEHFGNLLNPTQISWKEFQLEKLFAKKDLVLSILAGELYKKVEKVINDKMYILDEESKKEAVLIHHDIYLDNFIVKSDGSLILIDYGITFGGRPLFDLAKFFIWDLSKYSDQKSNFLSAYSKYISLPDNFTDVMSFYIIRECFGMIDFFTKINDIKMRNIAIETLEDLVSGEGVISKLLS